jgi:DNA-binding transcriptional ArsR family regulator
MSGPWILLGRSDRGEFRVPAQALVTGRTAVIGQSGSGKSWTIGVVCEQLCRAGAGFCIVDTEGEYFSLKERFQLLWVGKDPAADLDIDEVDVRRLSSIAVGESVPVIFDTSEVLDEREKVAELCRALYAAESELRVPYLLIVEEADKFAPQRGKPIQELREISRRGRKRGLGLLLATQRPAFLSKDLLSQCDSQLIGKLTVEADLAAVSLFFPSRRELEELPRLRPGEFFVLGSLAGQKVKIKVIERETTHRGFTPKLLPRPVGRISEIAEKLAGAPEAGAPVPARRSVRPRAQRPAEWHALQPRLDRQAALKLAEAKKRKRFVLFGPEEVLTGFGLEHWPLVFVEVAYTGGLIRKGWKTSSFILDGVSGALVDLRGGLKRRRGFEDLVGLDETEARVLIALARSGEASIPELEERTGLSPSTLRRAIRGLQERRLVTYRRAGRANVYLPLRDIHVPKLGQRVAFTLPPKEELSSPVECRLTEDALRAVLKAIDPTSDLVRFEVFYYPIYVARFAGRRLEIDGMTGKVVHLRGR